MHKIVSKQEKKILENFSGPATVWTRRFQFRTLVYKPLQQYHAITILMCKLRYINITSTIQQQSYFQKRLVFKQR